MVTKIKAIHELFISLKETQPVLCLQWIQLVFLFGFHDENWWTTLQGCYAICVSGAEHRKNHLKDLFVFHLMLNDPETAMLMFPDTAV